MRAKDGKFLPGASGNPAGKKTGSRHKATMSALALLDGQAEGLTQKVIELALAGDVQCLALCLARLVPPARERTINIKLPAVASAADVVQASVTILSAVCSGRITPGEGESLCRMLDVHRRCVDLVDIDERLRKLEALDGNQ